MRHTKHEPHAVLKHVSMSHMRQIEHESHAALASIALLGRGSNDISSCSAIIGYNMNDHKRDNLSHNNKQFSFNLLSFVSPWQDMGFVTKVLDKCISSSKLFIIHFIIASSFISSNKSAQQ